jgi:hypothetical protein
VEIYVAAVQARSGKKERQDKTQFTTKIGGGAQEKKKDRIKLNLQPKLVEALRKKERQDETQFTTKIGGGAHEKKKDRMKLSLQPKLVDLLIINSGFWCCVFLTLRITLLSLGSGYLKKT